VLREDLKGTGAGEMGYSTSEVGDLIVAFIEASEERRMRKDGQIV
jgi:hypothetical protein